MISRHAEASDLPAVVTLAAEVVGPERAGAFVRSHADRLKELYKQIRPGTY